MRGWRSEWKLSSQTYPPDALLVLAFPVVHLGRSAVHSGLAALTEAGR